MGETISIVRPRRTRYSTRGQIHQSFNPPIRQSSVTIQIFGTKKSPATRAALRFFAERRIQVHFVDLNERAASVGELRRFAQKFGVEAMLDREGRRFEELGLKAARYGEDAWLAKLADEPLLLKQPLVRNENQLTIGEAVETWKTWLASQ